MLIVYLVIGTLFLGVILALLARVIWRALRTGVLAYGTPGEVDAFVAHRKREPGLFWFMVFFYMLLAAGLAFALLRPWL
jgi:hypothetical protein